MGKKANDDALTSAYLLQFEAQHAKKYFTMNMNMNYPRRG